MLAPDEILKKSIEVGKKKAELPWWKMLLLGIFAGAFIALAGVGSTIGGFLGGKIVAAMIFPAGLFMVVVAGSELFTGNNLMVTALFSKKIGVLKLLKNWGLVFAGNLVGALIVTVIAVYSGVLDSMSDTVIAAAMSKVNLGFLEAMLRGILCNFLVCVAVWIAFSADTVPGKAVAVFFPIMLFVLCGFEHSVADMYYVPAGMMMGGLAGGVAPSIAEFLFGNLLPVTIGNIIGGAVMVGGGYFLAYHKNLTKK